jgi:hypothetical protein
MIASRNPKNRLLCIFALIISAVATRSHGQAILSFSGSKGNNFMVKLAEPVTYTIDENYGANGQHTAPAFVFKGVGNDFSFAGSAASGTVTYSDNGGPPNPISGMYSGQTVGSLTPSDAYLWGNEEGVTVGEVITLSAGTILTYGGPLPANGSYTTYVMDGNGLDISTNGVSSVPEPVSTGVLGIAAIAVLCRRGNRGVNLRRPIYRPVRKQLPHLVLTPAICYSA